MQSPYCHHHPRSQLSFTTLHFIEVPIEPIFSRVLEVTITISDIGSQAGVVLLEQPGIYNDTVAVNAAANNITASSNLECVPPVDQLDPLVACPVGASFEALAASSTASSNRQSGQVVRLAYCMPPKGGLPDKRIRVVIGVYGIALAAGQSVVRYEAAWQIRDVPELSTLIGALPSLTAYDDSLASNQPASDTGGIASFIAYPNDVFRFTARLTGTNSGNLLVRRGTCPTPETYDYILRPDSTGTYGITTAECVGDQVLTDQQVWFVGLQSTAGVGSQTPPASLVSSVQIESVQKQGSRLLADASGTADWTGQCADIVGGCSSMLTVDQV